MRRISRLVLGLLLALTSIPSIGEEYPIVKGKHRSFKRWHNHNTGSLGMCDVDFEDSKKISYSHWTEVPGVSASFDEEMAICILAEYLGHLFTKKVTLPADNAWGDTVFMICCSYKDGAIKYMGMIYPEVYGAITADQMEEFREAFVEAVRLTFPPKDLRFVYSEGLYLYRYLSIEAIRKRYQELRKKPWTGNSCNPTKPSAEQKKADSIRLRQIIAQPK